MAIKKSKNKVEETDSLIGESKDATDTLIAKLNKELKGGKIVRASEMEGLYLLRRPTGITSLDLEIAGGFPARGVTQLVGAENSGKTALAYQVCKNVQKTYGAETRIALLMVEPFDKAFAKNIGFHVAYSNKEIEQLTRAYNRPLSEEEVTYMQTEIGKVYHLNYPTAEMLLQAALGLIESNKFHVIVIDSLAAMETEAESEKALDEFSRGGISKTLSAFFKKLAPLTYDTSVIMINQLRDNMDAGLYGKKYVIPGGRALKHGNFLTIVLSSGERFKEKINDREIQYGKEINFIVDKGKAGCSEGGKGSYPFYNGELGRQLGFHVGQDLLVMGVYYGVIEQSGAYYSFENERIGLGKEAAGDFLNKHTEMYDRVRAEVFKRAEVTYLTKE